MPAEQWAAIKTQAEALLDQRVKEMTRQCSVYAWCNNPSLPEHAELHASDAVVLSGVDAAGEAGWWCWLVDQQDNDQGVQVVFEGRLPGASQTCS